jgi:hypothetical protein
MVISFDAGARQVLARAGPDETLVLAYRPARGCCGVPGLTTRWSTLDDAAQDPRLVRVGEAEGLTVFVDRRLRPQLTGDSLTFTTTGLGRWRRLVPVDHRRIIVGLMYGLEPHTDR